jgi:hypothetical protein
MHEHTGLCLQRDLQRGYNYVSVEGCSYIDMARGLLAERVLRVMERHPEHDTVFFIDNDMRWKPEQIDSLVDTVRVVHDKLHKSPLLHATYPQRGEKGLCCHYRLQIDGEGVERQLLGWPGVVGGMGFCCIHRDGFLKFAAQCGRYYVPSMQAYAVDMFPTGIVQGRWYGEDVLHCIRQFEHGWGSYWTGMIVEHMASNYGSSHAPRYPSEESLAELRGEVTRNQECQNEQDAPPATA